MRQGTIVTVAPTVAMIDATAAKLQLRIEPDDTSLDDHIDDLIAAATAKIENDLGYPVMRQTLETHLQAFPCGKIWLGGGQAPSVASITYLDTAGTRQTLDGAAWALDAISRPATVQPITIWPRTVDRRPGVVIITWSAGWVGNGDVPDDLAHAAKLLISHWDQNREAVALGIISTEIQQGYEALISPHRLRLVA